MLSVGLVVVVGFRLVVVFDEFETVFGDCFGGVFVLLCDHLDCVVKGLWFVVCWLGFVLVYEEKVVVLLNECEHFGWVDGYG